MEIQNYRRHLPHWRVDGATYAVTWRLHPRQPSLTEMERDQMVSALRFFDQERYALIAFVVMDDHVHVLLTPANSWSLSRIVHSWKSFTAHTWARISGRAAPVWQDESYDRIMRDERELTRTAEYLLDNPFRRWSDISGYAWMGTGSGAEEPGDPAQGD